MVKMAKGPFMEYLRATVTQSAPNTYTEIQFPTPASKTETLAMLIHSIELHPSALMEIAPTSADSISAHLSEASKTSVRTIIDPDILAYYLAFTILDAVASQLVITGEQKATFDPPILYPKAKLYLGINTTGFVAEKNVICKIGYTLEKVSREDFISALVE